MEAAAAASEQVVERLAGWLERMEDTSVPVPRSEWTVGEIGAHLAYTTIGFSMFARDLFYPHGDGTAQSLADANEVGLMGFPERGGPELARRLRQGTNSFLAEVGARSPEQHTYSPLGELTLGQLTSYFLAHNLMHGCAVSAALEEEFPFRPEHLPLIWPFLCYALQGPLVDPEALQGIETAVDISVTDGFDFSISFAGGGARFLAQPAGGSAACRIEVDARHLFLVMIKLLSVQEAVDLGVMTIRGPDPSVGLRFMDFFYVP